MNPFKNFLTLLATILTVSVNSQSVTGNLYYSTGNTHIIGLDILATYPSNLVIGIGGNHASKTFFSSELRNGNDFRDMSKNIVGFNGSQHYLIESFVEDRGAVYGLFGYSFNDQKTTIVSDLGISFKQRIYLYTSTLLNSTQLYPYNTNEYVSHGSSSVTYGGTVIQKIKGRVAVLAGYNNIQKFKFGINYRITPTNLLK